VRAKVIWSRDGLTCRCYIEGKEVSREEFDAALPAKPLEGPPAGPSTSGWPLLSDAMAVHPLDIQEAMDDARRKGVPTNFDPEDGRAEFRDRGHRRDYLRAYGKHDRDACYGD
jgi:hypothetical protein